MVTTAIKLPSLLILYAGSAVQADNKFPLVPDDLDVSLYAKEPLVRNPCAITFDAKGRLCVGMGPQYRKPQPDTPGDSVWILIDRDRDGVADSRREFATGFNSIQGLVWKGRDLWVANAPDLTVVRDLDGDDVADEYLRVYTDLGNLEHALHGLNVGPDGKIYMSKGNSKGLTLPPDRVAPKPFRDLWGIDAPGAPDFPQPIVFKKGDYQKNYHDPADDWGVTGGVLRCDDGGANLETVARGFRNPWDIAFDNEFNWLGTDNDQTLGDKIFSPFLGADFGWGHAWSYDWKGDDHLPTVPSSGPLFEGSGTGVVFLASPAFPPKYQNVWLVNDWLRRETYIFRPEWDGAHLVPRGGSYSEELFAHAGGGRAMGQSEGRAYDPTDIEVGPDGAVYVASWGRVYGARYEDGEQANEGRVYRFIPKGVELGAWSRPAQPPGEREIATLIADLGSDLSAWRVEAQMELLRRGGDATLAALEEALAGRGISTTQQTWAIWTLGRLDPKDSKVETSLERMALANRVGNNLRIQALRILAHRARLRGDRALADGLVRLLADPEPRIRHAAILAAHEADERRWNGALLELCATEPDRIVYYSAWKALLAMMPREKRKILLGVEKRAGARRALLLSLLEEDALSRGEIGKLADDPDAQIAALASRRLGGKAETEIRGRPLRPGELAESDERPPTPPEVKPPVNPVGSVKSSTGAPYRVTVLERGMRAYTDRNYRIEVLPPELRGEVLVQTANDDADADDGITVQLDLRYPSTLYLADDKRGAQPPRWAREDWQETDLEFAVAELIGLQGMRVLRRDVPAGTIELGTNRDGLTARKGNYFLVVVPRLLDPPPKPTRVDDVLPLVAKADPARGRDLFLSKHGAACAVCHRLEGVGNIHAPDLSEIGYRAQPEFIVRSVLEPSAAITEGFGMQILKKKSGESFAGVLLEETGVQLKLAMTGGAVVTVPRKELAGREYPKISAMPASFPSLLQPQQVADITAYLVSLKKGEQSTAKPLPEAAEGVFRFAEDGEDKLALYLGDTLLATYLKDDPVLTRRAFVNVRSPSGIPVTREFPAPESEDHTHMHPGIWLGFGWVSGNDYWRLQSKVAFDKFLQEPQVEGGEASFATRNRYLSRDGSTTICYEDTHYQFRNVPGGVLLNVDATFYNDERDFAFGDQEESGLAVRLSKALNVKDGGGAIVNDRGERDGAGTWGNEFSWIDYSGTIDGKRVGLLIVPHPDNPRPSWAHSRDYGVLVANPFPKQPRERREPYVETEIKKGERFRLRYSVLIHEGMEEQFDPRRLVEAASTGS